jgi:hypothetical protein
MKTTNYEISKQLAEAGFEGQQRPDCCARGNEFNFYEIKENEMLKNPTKLFGMRYYAYDLETILEALPRGLRVEGKYWELGLHFREFGKSISYNNGSIAVYLEENESLADVAAKMWLKLKKEGLS